MEQELVFFPRVKRIELVKDELCKEQRREKEIKDFIEQVEHSTLPVDVENSIKGQLSSELQLCKEQITQITYDLQKITYER